MQGVFRDAIKVKCGWNPTEILELEMQFLKE